MEQSTLDVQKHIKYWQRCLKSLLPTDYTSGDSSRMMLAFLILGALDILGAGAEHFPEVERKGLRDWILSCQHPNGGFCGSPNHKYPLGFYSKTKDVDPANLPATFFAIINLSFVGSLRDINRVGLLRWLKTLQREDGSFGELLEKDGKIGGGRDMRYCHFAAGVRWLLRGDLAGSEGNNFQDIDVDGLVKHIRAGETYDGGLGESSEHEAHAGYTYCGTASLSFLDRLPTSPTKTETAYTKLTGLTNIPATIRWLISRQLSYIETDAEDDEEDQSKPLMSVLGYQEKADVPSLAALTLNETQFVGCNGRLNKEADTCYCFWVVATLQILGKDNLINAEGARRFLIDQTEHRIGGFGKQPGYPPDLYHSYLALGTLSIMGEPGLKPFDPVLSISIAAKENIQKDVNDNLVPIHMYWQDERVYVTSETDPDYAQNMNLNEGPPQFWKNIIKDIGESEKNKNSSNDVVAEA